MSDLTPRHRILVVDDDPAQLEVLACFLEERYEVTACGGGEEALALVEGGRRFDLVLADQRMPGMSGVELLSRLRQGEPEPMRLILSGLADTADLMSAINQGEVYRYVLKPWRVEELLSTVEQALERHQLVRERARLVEELEAKNAELRALNEALEQKVLKRTAELEEANHALSQAVEKITVLAQTDPLTGLANRRRLFELGEQERLRADRFGRKYSVLLVDVDHFKAVNDTHGHAAGDEVLRVVAARLVQSVRRVDLAARYGGEEFALLLPETSEEGALVVAERVRAAVRGRPIEAGAGTPPLTIRVSVGVASSGGEEALAAVVSRADERLYQAKRGGRDRVVGPEPRASGAALLKDGGQPPKTAP